VNFRSEVSVCTTLTVIVSNLKVEIKKNNL
jgi:hypothetical protein